MLDFVKVTFSEFRAFLVILSLFVVSPECFQCKLLILIYRPSCVVLVSWFWYWDPVVRSWRARFTKNLTTNLG